MELDLQAAGLRRSAFAISLAACRQLMEKHWQPYLDGKSDFAQAIKQMVADL
jgi:hypothetical protein